MSFSSRSGADLSKEKQLISKQDRSEYSFKYKEINTIKISKFQIKFSTI